MFVQVAPGVDVPTLLSRCLAWDRAVGNTFQACKHLQSCLHLSWMDTCGPRCRMGPVQGDKPHTVPLPTLGMQQMG